jgi:hypothetical protein
MSVERSASDHWARSSWVLVGIVAALVVAFLAITGAYLKGIFDKSAEDTARNRFIACVQNWSDAYSRRADLLQQLSTERTDALDTYIHGERSFLINLAGHKGNDAEAFARLLQNSNDYARASHAYKLAARKHPVPASPQFVCSGGKEGVAPGHITGAARPSVGPSAATPSAPPTRPQPSGPAPVPARPTTAVRTISEPHATRSTTITRTRPAPPPSTRTVTRPAPPPTSSRPNVVRSLLCGLSLCRTETP